MEQVLNFILFVTFCVVGGFLGILIAWGVNHAATHSENVRKEREDA